jgi:hypothetical protein
MKSCQLFTVVPRELLPLTTTHMSRKSRPTVIHVINWRGGFCADGGC